MTAVLFTISAVLLLLALHPFITYPLSLLVLRRLRTPRTEQAATLEADRAATFTICMCAYNEAAIIRKKAENLRALKAREPGLQILVYVDAATDGTAELLKPYSDTLEVHVAPQRRGKTHGMNLLAARATGSIVLFTDANVMLDLDCLDNLRREFADPEVGCVCGQLTYINEGESITAATGSLYWRLEEGIKSLEQQTGSVMGADGSLFAIRRHLHCAPPDHIIDDMYVSFMVLLQGFRIIQSRDVRAYELSASNTHEEFSRKSRIACQAFNVHRLIWPQLRRRDAMTVYQYVSHKWLRWLSIYFLALAAVSFFGALLLAGWFSTASVLLALGIVGAALGSVWSVKPFAQLVDVLVSLAGAGLGVWKSVRGESFQTWTPVASVRRASE